MPLTKACRVTPCGVTTPKANGFALWQTLSAPINMNQLKSSGINHFKRINLPGPSQLKPSKYGANSHKTRSKTRQKSRKKHAVYGAGSACHCGGVAADVTVSSQACHGFVTVLNLNGNPAN
jgi:hypothetical protein